MALAVCVPANREISTMNDVVNEMAHDFELAVLADEEPTILDFEQVAARLETCEYCGCCPCGCGG
jgi:hypothetical protein